jgi:hypothetical protein
VQPASSASNNASLHKLVEINALFSRPPARSLPPWFLMVSIGDGGNIRALKCQETHRSKTVGMNAQPSKRGVGAVLKNPVPGCCGSFHDAPPA